MHAPLRTLPRSLFVLAVAMIALLAVTLLPSSDSEAGATPPPGKGWRKSQPSTTSSSTSAVMPAETTTTTAAPTTTTAAPTTTTTAPAPTTTTTTAVPTPALLWSARHEGGTVDEWRANQGGGLYNSGSYEVVNSGDVAHGGSRSMRARIWTPSSPTSGVRAFRWAEARANRELYYSVWVYFPEKVTLTQDHFNLFQFKSRSTSGRNDPVWAFYGVPDGAGGLRIRAGWGWGGTPISGPRATDGVGGKWFEPKTVQSLPVGRWVHLEAYLRQSKDFDGRLRFWQDGVELFDLQNVRTSFDNCTYNSWCASNEWAVNLYSDGLSKSPATMYIDDAAIARSYIP